MFQTTFFQKNEIVKNKTSLRGRVLFPATRNMGSPVGNLSKKRKIEKKNNNAEAQQLYVVEDLNIESVMGLEFVTFPKMLIKIAMNNEPQWIKYLKNKEVKLFINSLECEGILCPNITKIVEDLDRVIVNDKIDLKNISSEALEEFLNKFK